MSGTHEPAGTPDDPRDRMVDMLLWEAVGRQEPPNLVGRILRRAEAEQRVRHLRLVAYVAASAALVGLVISGFLWLNRPASQQQFVKPSEIPAPPAKTIVPEPETKTQLAQAPEPSKPEVPPARPEWTRGSVVETAAEGTAGVLGGYAHVEAGPHSRVRVEGQEKAERIFLERGYVTCAVDHHQGSFTVATPAGAVVVTGTKFSVKVPQPDGAEHHAELRPQQVVVKVAEGSVQLRGEWGHTALEAGEMGGSAMGLLANRGEDLFMLKVDGEREPQKFSMRGKDGKLDREIFERLQKLGPGSKLQLAWKQQKEARRIVGVEVFEARPREGSVTGVLIERGDAWIKVKTERGEVERYNARWVGGMPAQGGGPDKETVNKIAHLKVGEKVRVDWVLDEGFRIVRLARADGEREREAVRKEGGDKPREKEREMRREPVQDKEREKPREEKVRD